MLKSALLFKRRTVRKWHAQTGFSGGPLIHELIVPSGPEGRPGERLMSASRSLYAPRICPDGSREDFRVLVDRHGSTLAAVCLRQSSGPGDVKESAWKSLRRMLDLGAAGPYDVTVDRVAGETAYRHSTILRRGVLTDWTLGHAGWLYVVGVLSWAPAEEHHLTLQSTLAALATWRWLDDQQPA